MLRKIASKFQNEFLFADMLIFLTMFVIFYAQENTAIDVLELMEPGSEQCNGHSTTEFKVDTNR